jgi:hypothetical protein
MKRLRWIIVPLAWLVLVAAGITALLVTSETAREVTLDSLQLAFSIVTTPFILESLSAMLFLLGLLAYNRWRLQKEGDGWVYLMTQESEVVGNGPGATRQIHSVILPHRPEPVNEDEDEAGVIEGYLELGLAAQALQELKRVDTGSAETLDILLLRIRVLAANLDTHAARTLLHEAAQRYPGEQARLALNADQTAAWMRVHLPSHPAEAGLWRDEAAQMRTA